MGFSSKMGVSGLVAALAGCSFVPEYVRPNVAFSNSWTAPVSGTEVVARKWWAALGSAELDDLIEKSLTQNNDLAAAAERVAQARGHLRVAGASLLPNVSVGATYDYAKADVNAGGRSSGGATASASYELDLFGANRAAKAAAERRLAAAGFDAQALALTTASDVAQTYVNLLAMRERVALAEESLATSRRILDLLETRLRVGASGLLEVTQQRTAVAQAEASAASLKEQETALRTALAILVGVAPQDFAVAGQSLAGLHAPQVALAQPATLLERRPDLKVAEANLQAADADIGAARAAFFPSTSLSAGLTQGFDPAVTGLNLGAALLAPIFKGGANAGNLQAVTARQRELAATYRQAVLTAFGEGENALAALQSAQTREASQRTAAEQAATALRLARLQLEAGSVDLPTLLATQASDLSARDGLVQARADAMNGGVQVIRVMGGAVE